MSPQTFADLLERATEVAPPAPPAGPEVERGRRMLRRRRAALVAAVLCVSTGMFGMTAWAMRDDPRSVVAVDGSNNVQGLTTACVQGRAYTADGTSVDPQEVFRGDSVVVRNALDSGQQAVAAVDAGDGRHWAECVVHHDADERATMVVFDSNDEAPVPSWTTGPDCPPSGGLDDCPSWHVYAVFRLPDDVGWAQFTLADGQVVDVPSRGGYFVLNRVGPVPNGLGYEAWSGRSGFDAVTAVTYYEPGGHMVAGGAGPGLTETVEGLPPLSTYPVMGAPQQVFP